MLPRPLKNQFAAAIQRMLRPVVRQLIAYGVHYPTLSELVKRVYVEVAEQDFALPFKRQTDSRLALITGLNRKEISRLRQQKKSGGQVVEVEDTVVTHVIGRWMAGAPYSAPDGTPHQLLYDAAQPRRATFTSLVRSLGTDIPVRSVLDELLHVGAVELLPNGDVRLKGQVHIPAAAIEGKLTLLGSDPAELFSTIAHNIEHPEAPKLQRKVVYDNVGSAALPEIRAAAGALGEEFVRRANVLLSSYDRDRNPAAPTGERARVVLATYYYDEDVVLPEPSDTTGETHSPPGRIRRSR